MGLKNAVLQNKIQRLLFYIYVYFHNNEKKIDLNFILINYLVFLGFRFTFSKYIIVERKNGKNENFYAVFFPNIIHYIKLPVFVFYLYMLIK